MGFFNKINNSRPMIDDALKQLPDREDSKIFLYECLAIRRTRPRCVSLKE